MQLSSAAGSRKVSQPVCLFISLSFSLSFSPSLFVHQIHHCSSNTCAVVSRHHRLSVPPHLYPHSMNSTPLIVLSPGPLVHCAFFYFLSCRADSLCSPTDRPHGASEARDRVPPVLRGAVHEDARAWAMRSAQVRSWTSREDHVQGVALCGGVGLPIDELL